MPFRALAGAACLIGAAALCPPALAAVPAIIGPPFPQFASAADLQRRCTQGLAEARQGLRAIERLPADARWLDAYDRYSARLEDLANPVQFMLNVHPDKTIRTAAEACELRWNDFYSTLGQNPLLYRAVKRLQPTAESDQLLRQTLLEAFDDAGVGLAAAQRARAKQLNDRISALGQTFERQVRDANVRLAFTEDELQGVPATVWQGAKRDADGRVLLGVDYPSYDPVMQSAERASTRERMWRGKTNEGGEANLLVLAEITRLRKDYASLLGAASWSEFVLRRRMAESPARALGFLDEVKAAVQQRERDELADLRALKAKHLKQDEASTRVDRWDVNFYTELARQAQYRVDQEAFRAYFPPQPSLQFALHLIERLMGVRYQRVEGAAAWHPEVQTYAVSDAATGQPLATLFVDLYPREGKYNHAAVWGLRSASAVQGRPSQAALVVNFDRKGLTLDELQTLLHELGHAVHNNLSTARRALQAGTSVKHDFVEAPSQMLEDWIFDPQAVALFADVCPACTPVPAPLLKQAKAAAQYGKGLRSSRQHLYATYDLTLYGPTLQDPMALWARMEGDTPLGHVPGTMFPAGFAHIATNYSAGYYGYLWSLVVAMDLRTAFAADRLDARVGRRYRDTVLAPGGQRPPQALVRDFLGRDFNAKAFFDDLQQ